MISVIFRESLFLLNKVVEKIDSFMDDYTVDEYMRIRNFL